MVASEDASSSQTAQAITYKQYKDEHDLPMVMSLIDNELSEPYSIFTYRYFLVHWPHLCFLALDGGRCFGVVVAKADVHRGRRLRGYIAMLVVEAAYRSLGVGSALVRRVVAAMTDAGCAEVSLEAEVSNAGALRLYERLGFLRDKRLARYYLNGSDAFRLKLLLREDEPGDAGEQGGAATALGEVAAQEQEERDEAALAAEQLRQMQLQVGHVHTQQVEDES
eukprot:scaffold3.g6203.t1